MKAQNQLKTFVRLLEEYPCDTPLYKFLPVFYRKNKQMGSTDRRIATRLIYNYFRLGKALSELPPQERLMIAEFVCNEHENSFLSYFKPEFSSKINLPIPEKIEILKQVYPRFSLEDVFCWTAELSDTIDKEQFLYSFFQQPNLFIRINKGYEQEVKSTLIQKDISFKKVSPGCIALNNGTKLDSIFPEKRNFEVQDLSSQQTATYFKPQRWDKWWDACAASGGKSLLLYEEEPDIKLVVSDVRESILANLDERFQQAGLLKYQKKILDLTQDPEPYMHDYEFDGILLDVPCSGSGTWGRTPEMIQQFSLSKLDFFNRLQKSIARNTVKYLKPGKPLIYMTCSAFRSENEDMVEFLVNELGLSLEKCEILKGYEHKADVMFVARMIRN